MKTTQPVKAPVVAKKVESPTKASYLKEDVEREFEANLKQNTFILKFILPSNKLQKISYIRDPSGQIREVKTREVLPRN